VVWLEVEGLRALRRGLRLLHLLPSRLFLLGRLSRSARVGGCYCCDRVALVWWRGHSFPARHQAHRGRAGEGGRYVGEGAAGEEDAAGGRGARAVHIPAPEKTYRILEPGRVYVHRLSFSGLHLDRELRRQRVRALCGGSGVLCAGARRSLCQEMSTYCLS